MAIHTDGRGNLTTRTYSGGGYTSAPYQAAPQQAEPYDPFAQYADAFQPTSAFQSIIPPDGVPVQPVTPVAISPDGVLLSKYNQFLMEPGRRINPDTIGTAAIDRDTGRMIVPGVAEEYAAANRNNRENALEGDLRKAARSAWRRGQTDDALRYEGQVREMNADRGSSYESRLRYFLNMARATSPPPTPSANGFS